MASVPWIQGSYMWILMNKPEELPARPMWMLKHCFRLALERPPGHRKTRSHCISKNTLQPIKEN
jgi:hypothetical protein